MNQKSYAAALQLIRLMEFDETLTNAAEPFNWYHNLIHQMYDYEENKMRMYNKLAIESLVSKGVYFPTFSNEEDDDDFASYNLDLVKKSFKILETEFKDLIEFSQYHVDFIVKNGLRFEIKNSCYDENLVDGFEEFNIWVYGSCAIHKSMEKAVNFTDWVATDHSDFIGFCHISSDQAH